MAKAPEQEVRETIDLMLSLAGWNIQDCRDANIRARFGVAIRNFPLKSGHGFAEPIVRRRFCKSLSNFFEMYQALADSWTIFDNSGDSPRMIAFEESGKLEILDPELSRLLSEHKEKQ